MDGSRRMPLRVAFIEPWGERAGGAEEMLWMFLRHVDRSRVEPAVAFLQPGSFEEEARALGLGTGVVPAPRLRHPLSTLRTIRELASFIHAQNADLVVGWLPKTHVYGFGAALR